MFQNIYMQARRDNVRESVGESESERERHFILPQLPLAPFSLSLTLSHSFSLAFSLTHTFLYRLVGYNYLASVMYVHIGTIIGRSSWIPVLTAHTLSREYPIARPNCLEKYSVFIVIFPRSYTVFLFLIPLLSTFSLTYRQYFLSLSFSNSFSPPLAFSFSHCLSPVYSPSLLNWECIAVMKLPIQASDFVFSRTLLFFLLSLSRLHILFSFVYKNKVQEQRAPLSTL